MSQILVTGEAKIRDIQGPVVSNSGVITALDGDASQYVRGDGTLADFPTSTGGGSSVSYYLNSSVSQGTIGGVAYRQLSKTPISGAGTDIAISANGYVASYITDANDPALLEVPAGNFNCEFYFSVNSNAHNPYVYAELYKYDGTTFTLLGSSQSVPEYLTNGTTLSPYYFAIPVAVAALTITDRLAIRIYVNVDGRVVTLHTENNHLCQVVTTFSKGLISLNNLTRQNQFFATGTSGTDFGISSSVATHTFNLPVASATNTGKLSSTDWSTFNGKVPYTGATASVNLGVYDLIASGIYGTFIEASVNGLASSPLVLRTGTTGFSSGTDAVSLISSPTSAHTLSIISNIASPNVTKRANIGLDLLSATRTFTLPDITGTLALLEGSQTFSGAKSFSGGATFTSLLNINRQVNINKTPSLVAFTGGYITNYGTSNGIIYADGDTGNLTTFIYNFGGNYNYTFPAASGTLALTSNLSSYVPYTGATGAVNLGAFDLTVNGLTIGRGASAISSNTAIGTSSLAANTTGYSNTAVGQGSLLVNTTGYNNVALGQAALSGNTTGAQNIAIGVAALQNNTTASNNLVIGHGAMSANNTGSGNIAIGTGTLASNTTASNNTAVGYDSLSANTTGENNTSLGFQSLKANTTGSSNVAIGSSALLSNTTAINNTAVGYNSLRANTTGNNNVALGVDALLTNTTGDYNTALANSTLQLNTTGADNVAIGHATLNKNTTGNNSTGIGYSALNSNTTGNNNTAVGFTALGSVTTGIFNTAIGPGTGNAITTGSYNTIIGNYAGTTTLSNNIILADGAGNIRYQWDGTNNVFGNPISGTSATFSSSLTAQSLTATNGNNGVLTLGSATYFGTIQHDATTTGATIYTTAAASGGGHIFKIGTTTALTIASTGAATFSSSVTSSLGSAGANFNSNAATTGSVNAYRVSNTTGTASFGIDNSVGGDLITGGLPYATLLQSISNTALQLGTNQTARLTITSGGNVGIGTTFVINPYLGAGQSGVLQVATNVAKTASGGPHPVAFFSSNDATYPLGLLVQTITGATTGARKVKLQGTEIGLSANDIVMQTDGGNVGIGTSSPNVYSGFTNLQVNGTNYGLVQVSSGTTLASFYAGNGTGFIGMTSNHAFTLFTNDTERMRITSGGNVLMGTTSDSAGVRLKVSGGIIGCLDVYNNTTGVGANLNIDANGFFARSTSSIKYKKNVENYTKGLAEVMQMRPVTYNSINKTETQTYAGLIAEEIHDLGLNEFVQYAEDGTPDALSYGNMVALLVKGMQEQQAQIEELKAKIK